MLGGTPQQLSGVTQMLATAMLLVARAPQKLVGSALLLDWVEQQRTRAAQELDGTGQMFDGAVQKLAGGGLVQLEGDLGGPRRYRHDGRVVPTGEFHCANR